VLSRGARRTARTNGERWARFLARHGVAVFITAVTGLLVVAIPAPSRACTSAYPTDSTAAPDSTQRKAYDLVSSGFGPGANGSPMVVVSEATTAVATQAADEAPGWATSPRCRSSTPSVTRRCSR
jgi:putative drug exporter of the RND superfamily